MELTINFLGTIVLFIGGNITRKAIRSDNIKKIIISAFVLAIGLLLSLMKFC